ncbi:hypothetical protein QTP88_027666 [Uroleucon formosanum]
MVTLSIRLRTSIEIDSAIEQLTNNVIKAAKLATSEIPARNNREITYPMEIRELVKKKQKKATKQMKKLKVYVPPIRKEDGSWASCDQDKDETYARYLDRASSRTISLLNLI